MVKKLKKCGLSMLLVVVLLISMVPEAFAYDGRITNESLGKALDAMGVPANVVALDLRDRTDIVGDVDISQLKTVYQDLAVVWLDGTNVVNITNGSAVSYLTHTNTLHSGKTLGSSGIVTYQDGADLQVSSLLAAIQMTNASGTAIALPSGLLESGGTGSVTINGTPYPVTVGGTISSTVMAGIPADTYQAVVNLPYAHSTSRMNVTVTLRIAREAHSYAQNLLTVYKGGNIDFVLRKNDINGASAPIGSMAGYSFDYTANGVTITPALSADGRTIIINAAANGANPASGFLRAYYNNVIVATARLVVGTNTTVSQFDLVEYNSGSASTATQTSGIAAAVTPDTLFFQGGTSIASVNSLSTALDYNSGTTYLFRDNLGGYIPYRYLSQAKIDIGAGGNGVPYSLNYDFVAIDDPTLLGTGEKILGVTFTSGYTSSTVWNDPSLGGVGTTPITVTLENGVGSGVSNQVIGLNFESYPKATAIGYEVFAVPAASANDNTSKADIEAQIKSNALEPIAHYTVNPGGSVTEDYSNLAEVVAGDYVNIVVAAYYTSGGQRFILNGSDIAWYHGTPAVNIITGGVSPLAGTTSTRADINTVIAGSYSNVLELYATAADDPANIFIIVDNISQSFNIKVQFVEPEIVRYILVPASGYTFQSGFSTYTEELEYVTANIATLGTNILYDYNVNHDGGTHPAGYSQNIAVYGVYNTQGPSETAISCTGTPEATVTSSDSGLRVTGSGTQFTATLLTAGIGDADAISGTTHTATVTDDTGIITTYLDFKVAKSEIIGTYSIYEDYFGNRYTTSRVLANAYIDIEFRSAAIEVPRGTTAKEYVVPEFSNPDFYDASIIWMDYTISLNGNHNTINNAAVGLNVNNTPAPNTSGASYYHLTWEATSAGSSVDQLAITLSSPAAIRLNGSTTYNVSSAVAAAGTLGIQSNLVGTAAIVTGIGVADGRTTPSTAIPNGGAISGGLGETIVVDNIQVRYSDDTIGPISAAEFANLTIASGGSLVNLSKHATNLEYEIKILSATTGAGADIYSEYVYGLNGATVTKKLYDISTSSTADYVFYVRCDGSTKIEGIYLVADGNEILGDSSGATLNYSMGEIYKVYPVILDSSYWLANASSPTAIAYSDVAGTTGLSFIDGSVFSGAATNFNYSTSGIIVSAVSNSAGNPMSYDFTAVGEGLNTVTFEFDTSSVTNTLYTEDYATSAPLTLAINQIAAMTSKYVVDINPRNQNTLGNRVTVDIEYAISDTSGGGNNILVPASTYQSNAISGVNTGATNTLTVTPTTIPAGASYTLSGSGSTLRINVDMVGQYTFKFTTLNNAGTSVPVSNTKSISFTVTGASDNATVRYGESTSIPGLSTYNWSSIVEIGGGSLLDQAALSSGVLKMADNMGGNTMVEVRDANGNAMLTVTVTAIDATFSTAELTTATSSSNMSTFAPGESKPLMWKVTYTYNPVGGIGGGTVVLYETIEPNAWVKVQSSSSNLTLSDDTVTATGSSSDFMIYDATYAAAGTPVTVRYWAYLDITTTPPIYTYAFSDSSSSYSQITSLQLSSAAAATNVYVWNTTGNSVCAVNAALSSDTNVATVSVSGNTVAITPISAGTATITAYPTTGGSVTLPVTVTSTPGPTPSTYNVTGTVTDGSTGIIGATVTLTSGSNSYPATTIAGGTFTVPNVANGTYSITVTQSGYNSGTGSVTVNGNNAVALPNPIILTASTPTPSTYKVTGTVTDGTAAPILGASVTVTDGTNYYTAATDSNGYFEALNVPNGTYDVTISATGYAPNASTIIVAGVDYGMGPITLTASPSSYDVFGTVDDGTNPISGALVVITDSSNTYAATTDANGAFTVSGVLDGNYNVTIDAMGYAQYTGTVTVSGGQENMGTISLTPVYDVTGRVVNNSGTGITTATVTLTSSTNTYTANTITGGVFTVQGVPDGTYTITVSASGYTTHTGTGSNSVTVNGGNVTGLSITLSTPSNPGGGGGGGGGGSAATTYSVTVKSAENGTVSSNSSSASSGTQVTLTVTPDTGYALSSINAVNASGTKITLTKASDTTYTFAMPESNVTVTPVFESGGISAHDCPSAPYRDANISAWYHEYVDYVIENGYMQGTASNAFEPNSTMTRAMMVQILYNMEGGPEAASTVTFGDVTSDKWYADAIAWAASEGIVQGYDDGNYYPNTNITREQMAAILYRYASYKGYDVSATTSLSSYSDQVQIGGYALTAIQWAVAEDLIQGRTTTTIVPNGTATRAEVATIITRFCEAE